jgi:hypothetical protein
MGVLTSLLKPHKMQQQQRTLQTVLLHLHHITHVQFLSAYCLALQPQQQAVVVVAQHKIIRCLNILCQLLL